MTNYDDIHRFLLRTIANRGVMTMTETADVLNQFKGENVNCSYIINLVQEINKEINPFKQRITIVKDKNTESCEETLIFIILIADKATKSQTIFSDKAVKYFMKLIEEIISTESREIEHYTALHLTRTFLTKKDAEGLLDRWSKMHYLKQIKTVHRSRNSESVNIKYTLGLRGIYEFETYFTDNLNNYVENCEQCREIVIMGCNCTMCGKALHKPCLNIHMESQHDNIRNSINFDDDIMDDSSSISTDEEAILLQSDTSDIAEPVSKRRRTRISTDSVEMLSDSDEF